MKILKSFGFVIALIVLILAYGSIYTVTEGHHALLLRLGAIVKNRQTGKDKLINPGLHFKTPFLNQVRIFDTRLQTFNVQSSRILTAEQKYVLVDYYAKWRISDLPLYYKRTGGHASHAQTLLQQKINDALRAAFGRHAISDVISGSRMDIMSLLKKKANDSAESLGINVIDVRIKRIDLPKQVSESVFERMRAEREQVATKHRAAGKAKAEAIRAKADAKVTVLLATAREKAAQTRANGDFKAAQVYAKAYDQDPSFYAFYRSVQAYEQTFNNKSDILVLKPDNQFFKYFNSASGNNKK